MKAAEFAALIVPMLEEHPEAEVYVATGYDNTGVIESVNYWAGKDGTESINIVVEA